MENLEKRFQHIIEVSAAPTDGFVIFEEAAKACASECRNISIAFAEYMLQEDYLLQGKNLIDHSIEQIFNHFITNVYKS